MKKLLTLLVVLVLLVAVAPAVFAADTIITTQPVSVEAPRGSYAEFSVVAEGAASYQWQYHAAGETEWKNCGSTFGGSKTATLSVFSKTAREGFVFRCVVKDAAGNEYISDEAVLTTSSIFASGPVDETVKMGNRANFTFELAEGVDPSSVKIQWLYNIPTGDPNYWLANTPFTMGYNATTLNVIAAEKREGFKYRVRVTDAEGIKHYSNEVCDPAVLTVDVPSPYAVLAQPVGAFAMNGSDVQFHVETEGEGLTYQWEYHRDINKTGGQYYWVAMGTTTGCKTDTLTVASVSGSTVRYGWYYRCRVTDPNGYVYETEPARLWEMTALVTEHPADQEAAVGEYVTYSATVQGEFEEVKWQFSKDGGKNFNASTAAVTKTVDGDKTTFSIKVQATEARDGYQYRVVVKDKTPNRTFPDGVTVGKVLMYSKAGKLTVKKDVEPIVITANPADVTVDLAGAATFTGAATGDGVAYQWYTKAAGSDEWVAVEGATAETLEVVASELNNGSFYKLVATDAHGQTAETTAAVLTVNLDVVFTLNPMFIPGTAETGVIPAGCTRVYTTMAGACNLIIESESVAVAYNGVTYEPVDGVVTVPLEFVNPRLGTQNTVEITNNGAEAASFTAKFEYPLGTMENPEVLEDLSMMGTTVAAGDVDGYYYVWTAPEDGTLVLTQDAGWDVLNDMVVTVNSTQNSMLMDGVDGTLTYEAKAGDVFMIQLVAVEKYLIDEETWEFVLDEDGNKVVDTQYPEAYVYAGGSFESGSENYPYTISADMVPATVTTPNVLTPGVAYYYNVQGGGVIVSTTDNVTISYNGVEYTPDENGNISFYLEPLNFWAGVTSNMLQITNNGEEAAAVNMSLSYEVGHMENPDVLVEGDNVASLREGNESGYFYNFVAPDKGVLTITVSGENGWSYMINNITVGTYGDRHESGNDPAVPSTSINVLEGDVIQVNVNTFDAENPWTAPEGEVTVNVVFEGLGDVEIEQPLPTLPEDGEE